MLDCSAQLCAGAPLLSHAGLRTGIGEAQETLKTAWRTLLLGCTSIGGPALLGKEKTAQPHRTFWIMML